MIRRARTELRPIPVGSMTGSKRNLKLFFIFLENTVKFTTPFSGPGH